jgi:hypothetical protein
MAAWLWQDAVAARSEIVQASQKLLRNLNFREAQATEGRHSAEYSVLTFNNREFL